MGKFKDALKKATKAVTNTVTDYGKLVVQATLQPTETLLGKNIYTPKYNTELGAKASEFGAKVNVIKTEVAKVYAGSAVSNKAKEEMAGATNPSISGKVQTGIQNLFGGTEIQQPTTGIMGVVKQNIGNLFGGAGPTGLGLPPFSINSGSGGLDLNIGATAMGKNTQGQLMAFLPVIIILGAAIFLIRWAFKGFK